MTSSPVPSLDQLITAIEEGVTDPLQQVSAAVLVATHMDELSDHLIGHFVDKARHSGASWTTIGQSLGVTKQAAQKRFVPTTPESAETDLRIFARYTDRARAVVVRAQQQAQHRAATEIRPGHLLLALLDDEQTREFLDGIDADAAAAAVSGLLGDKTGASEEPVPFAPVSKKALELGHREALRRNSDPIEPEHLLAGVLSMTDDPEVAACAAAGLDVGQVEQRLAG